MVNWKCRHAFHDLRTAADGLAGQFAMRWQSELRRMWYKSLYCNSFIYPHCLIAPPTNGINYRGRQLCPALANANTGGHAGSFWPGYFCMAISSNDVNKIHFTEVHRWWTAICFSVVGEEASRGEPGCGAKTSRPSSLQQNSSHLSRSGGDVKWTIFSFFAIWFFGFLLDRFRRNFYLLLGWGHRRETCATVRGSPPLVFFCLFFNPAATSIKQKSASEGERHATEISILLRMTTKRLI